MIAAFPLDEMPLVFLIPQIVFGCHVWQLGKESAQEKQEITNQNWRAKSKTLFQTAAKGEWESWIVFESCSQKIFSNTCTIMNMSIRGEGGTVNWMFISICKSTLINSSFTFLLLLYTMASAFLPWVLLWFTLNLIRMSVKNKEEKKPSF